MKVAVFDTKPYDRRYLELAAQGKSIAFEFFDFRLSVGTAAATRRAPAVCIFVNVTGEAFQEREICLSMDRAKGSDNQKDQKEWVSLENHH